MVDLKGYFRDHFQDMSSICPDPMKATGPAPAYIVYKARSIPVGAFKDLDLTTPEGMAWKELRMAAYKDSINLANRRMDRQDQEKGTAYEIIRSMCSASLNIILTSDKEFTDMTSNDPLQLLNILKRLIKGRRARRTRPVGCIGGVVRTQNEGRGGRRNVQQKGGQGHREDGSDEGREDQDPD